MKKKCGKGVDWEIWTDVGKKTKRKWLVFHLHVVIDVGAWKPSGIKRDKDGRDLGREKKHKDRRLEWGASNR